MYSASYNSHRRPSGERDFFNGEEIFFTFQGLNGINQASDFYFSPGREIPPGSSGDIYFYDLIVSDTAPFGPTQLNIGPSYIFDENYSIQGSELPTLNRTIMVVPSLQQMAQNLRGPQYAVPDQRFDQDGDGDMDLNDLAKFQVMYSQN